jgi:peptidoglycan hydrolase-like protein with peptidoglycan-binding domain
MTKAILVGLMAILCFGTVLRAQDAPAGQVWVQIEALPTLADAEERARAYTGVFGDVQGFQLRSGWFGILLGPYTADAAPARLAALRSERLIPGDSYLTDATSFRQQFWPVSLTGVVEEPLGQGASVAPDADLTLATPDVLTEPEVPALPEETMAEARDGEAVLDREGRQDLQTALQWFGFYPGEIDGAFGPGTRNSMAEWQIAKGFDPTGVLTTGQRTDLLSGYRSAQAELGLELVTEQESGIEILLPMSLVAFDHYEPPFVHFAEKDGSGVRVILISQPGDQSTLYGLYDTLQTLSVVPTEGARDRGERNFTLTGQSADLASHTFAELSGGLIKGYMLIWNPKDGERMGRVLAAMQSSFNPVGDRALDPGLVPMPDAQRRGLLAGLEVRRPTFSQTGFFVDADGSVLTSSVARAGCGRITLDLETDATVVQSDLASGATLLRPVKPLSPRNVADLATGTGQIGTEIAISGYSYGDQLPAPTLTFGTFEDAQGLAGEVGLNRLSISVLPGDAGGPVLDSAGTVLGMLLPESADAPRKLPKGVGFAASAQSLGAFLTKAGIPPVSSERSGALAPEDLNRLAEGMTVLVSCWE